MAPLPTTISHLPDDLLVHVLRFATDAARRDSLPTPSTSLLDWRYASVSSAFRRAFLKSISSLLLDGRPARALADLDWQPLDPCISIRRIEVASETTLTDSHLIRLFQRLQTNHCPIRQADISLDRSVTPVTLLRLASTFGSHVTHLAVRVPLGRRSRRRRDPHVIYHANNGHLHLAPHSDTFPSFPTAVQLPSPHQDPSLLPNPHLQPHPGVIHVFDDVPATAHHGFANLDQMMAAHLENGHEPIPNVHADHPMGDAPEESQMMEVVDNALFNVFQALEANAANATDDFNAALHVPITANATDSSHNHPGAADALNPSNSQHPHNFPQPTNPLAWGTTDASSQGTQPAEVVNGTTPGIHSPLHPHHVFNAGAHAANSLNHSQGHPSPPVSHSAQSGSINQMVPGGHGLQYEGSSLASARRSSPAIALSDDVLATVFSRMPFLKVLVIERGRHGMNAGILPLARCKNLESLSFISCAGISQVAVRNILSSLPRLRELRLVDLSSIGNASIFSLCSGPSRSSMRSLYLSRMNRVTDCAIKELVNSCENLESVYISDCNRITCEAASHLSCALSLRNIYFKPQSEFPLSNRTSIHLSCAASTVRSLELVGCKNLSLDGIVALGNLPSLHKLHLLGLGHISQDVMRQLGIFPKLDDLALEGPMFLTDLGVKVLCGQRGHRFLHLSLIDTTKNLTEEALDCIMTWCISLRSLEIHGQFKHGAIDRLREFIPSASLTVSSTISGRQHSSGIGGVWDPLVVAT